MTDIDTEQTTEVKRGRPARETETRAISERAMSWAPASILPEPVKEHGYAYRWIRVSTMGQSDPLNISSKFREGWQAVSREEQPQLAAISDRESRFDDGIEIAGLLLCKAPSDLMAQRTKYYENLTRSQMESVDNNFMRENDPRMPLFRERKSKVSFGSGN